VELLLQVGQHLRARLEHLHDLTVRFPENVGEACLTFRSPLTPPLRRRFYQHSP
jgi:hypothetical protein